MRHERRQAFRDTPWYQLAARAEEMVIGGSPNWNGKWNQQWYGIQRFLITWRARPTRCTSVCCCPSTAATRRAVCSGRRGSRRKVCSGASAAGRCRCDGSAGRPAWQPLWGSEAKALPRVPAPAPGVQWSRGSSSPLPGLCLHDLMLLPIDRLRQFFARMQLPVGDDAMGGDAQALKLLHEKSPAPQYLCDVGIGYLTLDRQSRTLSGGEVQRINLTTAWAPALVNTLFVLDEPSIGLHPRDMHRITEAMLRLRDAGNTWWWWSTTPP